jgi:hypothetical protein
MSIKGKIVTAATALTLTVGGGAAWTLTANAATPRCGSSCSDLYSRAFGSGFVLDVLNHVGRAGQPATLARASGASQGEDFRLDDLGKVADFHVAGLISGGLSALYGSLSVYEIDYTPNGSSTGLCLGVGTVPGVGTPVVLEPCGVSAKTVWIFDPEPASTGTYDALISAATGRNFRHPYSLTTLIPGTPLVTEPLATNVPGSVLAHQLWSAEAGVLPSAPTAS